MDPLLFVLISAATRDSNDSNSCFQDMHSDMVQSQHVENSGHRQTEEEEDEDIMPLQERDLESVSALLSLPAYCIVSLHHIPLPFQGLSTPLVMTVLQTGLLSLAALPELYCNSAQKKGKKKNMTQASA